MLTSRAICFSTINELHEFLQSENYKKHIARIVPENENQVLVINGVIQSLDSVHFLGENENESFSLQQVIADKAILKKLKRVTRNKKIYYIDKDNTKKFYPPISILEKQIHEKPFNSIAEKTPNQPLFFSGPFFRKHREHLLANLTSQLLVANDGNTYWLDDIFQSSNEDESVALLRFQNKEGMEFSVADIKTNQENQDFLATLIYNKPLAAAFCSMELTSQKILKWDDTEQKCIIMREPTIFPVIAPTGEIYEWRSIETYIEHKDANNLPHPLGIKTDLSRNQFISNKAVQSLNEIGFKQTCDSNLKEKEQLEISLQKDISINKKRINIHRYREIHSAQITIQNDRRNTLKENKNYVRSKISYVESKISKDDPRSVELLEEELEKLQTKATSLKKHRESLGKIIKNIALCSMFSFSITAVFSCFALFLPFTLIAAPIAIIALTAATISYFLDNLYLTPFSSKLSQELTRVEEQITDVNQTLESKKNPEKIEILNRFKQQDKKIESNLEQLTKIERAQDKLPCLQSQVNAEQVANKVSNKALQIIPPIKRTASSPLLYTSQSNEWQPATESPPTIKRSYSFKF